MRTYDETFERVMEKGKACIQKRKKARKNAIMICSSVMCVCLVIFAVAKSDRSDRPKPTVSEAQSNHESTITTDASSDNAVQDSLTTTVKQQSVSTASAEDYLPEEYNSSEEKKVIFALRNAVPAGEMDEIKTEQSCTDRVLVNGRDEELNEIPGYDPEKDGDLSVIYLEGEDFYYEVTVNERLDKIYRVKKFVN